MPSRLRDLKEDFFRLVSPVFCYFGSTKVFGFRSVWDYSSVKVTGFPLLLVVSLGDFFYL